MEHHVIVDPTVSRAIGQAVGQHRNLVVRLLARLYDDLEHRGEACRQQRDPEEPERICRHAITLLEGDTWHTFYFWIDDVQATGYLFVIGMSHLSGPAV